MMKNIYSAFDPNAVLEAMDDPEAVGVLQKHLDGGIKLKDRHNQTILAYRDANDGGDDDIDLDQAELEINEEAKAEVVNTVGQIVRRNTQQEKNNISQMQRDLQRLQSIKGGPMSEEMKMMLAARQQAITSAGAEFDKLDLDGSGEVDQKELVEFARAQAGSTRANMSTEDQVKAEAKLEAMIDRFDANDDGRVSKAEWSQFFGRMFDATMAQELAKGTQ